MEGKASIVWVPLAAVLAAGLMLGGLGALFTALGNQATIGIGLGITVFLPILGYLYLRSKGSSGF
ncbi:MAG: hypothetical protein EXR48_01375 [Dehalococcoidia bacterium]|nr:hypothetical protein [Dehalococcoidia bacterium]